MSLEIYKQKLESRSFTVSIKDDKIIFTCKDDHTKTLTYSSIKSLSSEVERAEREGRGDIKTFCNICNKLIRLEKEGSLKFRNYCEILKKAGCTIASTPQEADAVKTMFYDCARGQHRREIKYTSFGNLVGFVKEGKQSFCSECDRFDEVKDIVAGLGFGHELTEYIDDKHIKYNCGNCGRERTSNMVAIQKNTGVCGGR